MIGDYVLVRGKPGIYEVARKIKSAYQNYPGSDADFSNRFLLKEAEEIPQLAISLMKEKLEE